MAHDNDYHMDQLVKIQFEDMPYWVMPRYIHHYVHNTYEKFSLKLIKNLIQEGDTFLDIGAHYGAYSIYAAKKSGATVISMEPVNENYEIFSKNIKENKLEKQIETHNAAASDKDEEAEFNIPWASDSAGFYDHPLAETYKKQKVSVRNVDKLVDGRKIDFIKIDTEGHELVVLNGLKKTLNKNPHAKLLIEANPACLEVAGRTVEDLLRFLAEDADKELFVIDEDAFTMKRVTDDIKNWKKYIHGYANILCVPKVNTQYPLFVCHSSELGGGELALLENVLALRDQGVLSHVVIPGHGPLKSKLIELGISHSVYNYHFWANQNEGNSAERNMFNVESSAQISELTTEINPTVIINNSMVCPWGLRAAQQHKLPLIWFVHEFGDLDHAMKFNYPIDDIRKFITQESDLVVTCSETLRSVFDASNVRTLYPLLAAQQVAHKAKLQSIPRTIYKHKGFLKLIIVGRVQETKGQLDAVRAVAELNKQGKKAELVILGSANKEYLAKVKSEIKKFGLEEFVHYIKHADNPFPIIAQSEIALTCSKFEAFGRTTAEAMLLAKPVVGANAGGTAELIRDGEVGLLYQPGNAEDLADKIIKLEKAKFREKLGKNAQKHINELIDSLATSSLLLQYISHANQKTNRNLKSVLVSDELNGVEAARRDRIAARELIHEGNAVREEFEENQAVLQDEIERLSKELHSIYHSKHWKVSRPIRGVFRVGRKIKGYSENRSLQKDTDNAVTKYNNSLKKIKTMKRTPSVKLAIALHLFYPETWPMIKQKLDVISEFVKFDLFITTPDESKLSQEVKKSFERTVIIEVPNRGRDVLPFMQIAPILSKMGYESFLKLHSKKSKHRSDGSDWFAHILDNLVPDDPEIVKSILAKLGDESTGYIGPADEYVSLLVNYSANKQHLRKIVTDVTSHEQVKKMNVRPQDFGFIAGTMFWGRFDALRPILKQKYQVANFEVEKGQIDMTFAHALERAYIVVAELNGMSIYAANNDGLSRVEYSSGSIPDWSDLNKK